MGQMVYINGKLVPEDEAVVSVIDHGFMYGDGLFEGIRVYNGKVFKLKEHVARLYYGAKAIAIEIPMAQEQFVDAVREVVRTNEVVDGYIRVTVSRGPALGLDPRNCTKPTVVIMTGKLALYPEEMYRNGLNVVTVSTRVAPAQVLEPRIKSLGKYVANIQAKIEANMMDAGEGLMLNIQGYVAECTGDNIFIIKDGKLCTPPAYAGILEGITRAAVMDLAREAGIEVIEKMMTLFDIYTADECFLTGTAAEVIPVVDLDGRQIGDGKPGEMTNKLMKAFHAYTATEGVPV
jgi:branched-chain amino acid aminotransferase